MWPCCQPVVLHSPSHAPLRLHQEGGAVVCAMSSLLQQAHLHVAVNLAPLGGPVASTLVLHQTRERERESPLVSGIYG